jgi:hypothetical protein
MVIGAANLLAVAVRESKDDSILLINADTPKASEISATLFEAIGGKCPQILDRGAGIQQVEFLLHSAPEFAPDPAGGFRVVPVIEIGGRGIPETGDHGKSIPEYTLSVYTFRAEAFHGCNDSI